MLHLNKHSFIQLVICEFTHPPVLLTKVYISFATCSKLAIHFSNANESPQFLFYLVVLFLSLKPMLLNNTCGLPKEISPS